MGCCSNERNAATKVFQEEWSKFLYALRARGLKVDHIDSGGTTDSSAGVRCEGSVQIHFPLPSCVFPASKRWKYKT